MLSQTQLRQRVGPRPMASDAAPSLRISCFRQSHVFLYLGRSHTTESELESWASPAHGQVSHRPRCSFAMSRTLTTWNGLKASPSQQPPTAPAAATMGVVQTPPFIVTISRREIS